MPRNSQGVNCGDSIFISSGNRSYIKSPGYPSNYDDNLNCEWIIQTSEDMKIKVTIISLDIGKNISNITKSSFAISKFINKFSLAIAMGICAIVKIVDHEIL